MAEGHRSTFPGEIQKAAIAGWLRRLVADHDGPALIVAKTIGALLFEEGPSTWIRLSRIAGLTGQPNGVVARILYRLRKRRRLMFKRRDPGRSGVDPEFLFTIPRKLPPSIERARVWPIREVKKH